MRKQQKGKCHNSFVIVTAFINCYLCTLCTQQMSKEEEEENEKMKLCHTVASPKGEER